MPSNESRNANRLRAAMRWVELQAPAATMGIECPEPDCGASVGRLCGFTYPVAPHASRLEMARSELHAIALTLFDLE